MMVQNQPDDIATKKWLLARLRTMRAGLMLVVAQIDEIGIDLSGDIITTETAAVNVASLEQIPVYFAAHIFAPGEGCEA
jgi:hypothetical protein